MHKEIQLNKLLSIINQVLESSNKEPLETIQETASLRNDIGFDSLELAEMTVRIQDEFNVDVFQDGIVDTVSDLIKHVSEP